MTTTDRMSRFEAMFREHQDAILRYALRRLPREDAFEVAAETFAVAWAKLDRIPELPLPWLYRTAYGLTMNRRRKLSRQSRLDDRLVAIRAPHDDLESVESASDVVDRIRALGERDREVVRLLAREQLSVRDIAEILELYVDGYVLPKR